MAIPGTQQVTAQIAPSATTDVYPTHAEEYGKGGYQSVADSIERDAITTERRKEGMLVFTLDTQETWQLQNDLVTWALYSVGTPPGTITLIGDVTGTGTSPITTTLANSGVVAGTKGSASKSPTLTVNVKGLVTALSDQDIQITEAQVTNLVADLALKVDTALLGQPNGVATLDAGGFVPAGQLNFGVVNLINTWNATTNVPALADGIGAVGDGYLVSVGGTIDLGSGAQTFVPGDSIIYFGTLTWLKVATVFTGIQQITTDSGVLVGAAVTLNSTTQIADSLNRRYQTDLQKAVQDAAVVAGANAANRYALMSDIGGIVVGTTFLTPESLAGGHTLGDGTARILNTLIDPATGLNYTNPSAALAFPLVTGIDVTQDTIDFAALEQGSNQMAQGGTQNALYLGCWGERQYVINRALSIPKSVAKMSPQRFYYIGNGCLIWTTSTTQGIFDSLPVNQAETTTTTNTLVRISNMTLSAFSATTKGSGQVGIRLGGRDVIINDVLFSNYDLSIDLQFCLGAEINKCSVTGFKTTGFHFGPGTWAGASINNAAANCTVLKDCRANIIPLQDYGYHFEGGSDTTMYSCTAEGEMGASPLTDAPKNAVFYDSLDATAARGTFQIYGLYLEQYCFDSSIRIKAREGVYALHDISNQNQGLSAVACRNLIKLEAYGGGFVYFELHRFAHWTPNLQFYLGSTNTLPMFISPWSATAANLNVASRWSNIQPSLAQLQASVYLP